MLFFMTMSESTISGKKRKSGHGEVKAESKKRKVDSSTPGSKSDPTERSDRKKDKKRKRENANGDRSLIPEPTDPVVKLPTKSKTKKEKKEKKDTTLASEKIKSDEVEPQPESVSSPRENPSESKSAKVAKETKPGKKSKKKTKSKTSETSNGEPNETGAAQETKLEKKSKKKTKSKTKDASNGESNEMEAAKETKTEKKPKKKSKSKANGVSNGEPNEIEAAQAADDQSQHGSKTRFIVFIGLRPDSSVTRRLMPLGNLPFTATKDTIAKHFQAVEPQSIRLLSHKDTGKSKGCAFLEFNRYDRMKTCLKLFHHSSFDDGQSSARKINVDLT